MTNILQPQIKAIQLAIAVLTRDRRRFSAGHFAQQSGIRADRIQGEDVEGVGFEWVEKDHKRHIEYSEAIRQLEDMLEALQEI